MSSTTYTSTNNGCEAQNAPPIGCKPAWLVAWSRISDLIGAIERQYESPVGNAKLVERWAEEIIMQCRIIEHSEKRFNEDHEPYESSD